MKFIRSAGHEHHRSSTTIYDAMSFGYGKLDGNGFWEHGCYECARAWEQQFPENREECWPHSKETLERWFGKGTGMQIKMDRSAKEKQPIQIPPLQNPVEIDTSGLDFTR